MSLKIIIAKGVFGQKFASYIYLGEKYIQYCTYSCIYTVFCTVGIVKRYRFVKAGKSLTVRPL